MSVIHRSLHGSGAAGKSKPKGKTYERSAVKKVMGDMIKERSASAFARFHGLDQGSMMTLQREIKFVDNALTNTLFRSAATPPVGVYLGGPVQGAAPYQRVGQKIMNKSIHIRGIVVNSATSTEDLGRILVVYDRQPNGAVPTYATLIASYIAAGTSASTAYDGINMNNRERFKVLCDEQFRFPACTNTSGVLTNLAQIDATGNTAAAKWNFERFIRLKDLVTHFNTTNGGGIGDVTTGALLMFVVSQGNDSCWTFNWSSRLRFDDL